MNKGFWLAVITVTSALIGALAVQLWKDFEAQPQGSEEARPPGEKE